MRNHERRSAPNYTNAALVMGLINLFWSFLLIYASFGLPAVLVIAVGLNYAITRLAQHRVANDLRLTFQKENERLN